ncbi:hypothetical protein AB0G04_34645 [Actinoplanes sp. NPDC023801]|uniref:hypothetical protein n=1 Tax=Actinoplanes sp. NPDC023801 TaxID=3154595 RepID=UPI0033C1AB67
MRKWFVADGRVPGAAEGRRPKLANIEMGETSLVPKLNDIWCRISALARTV